MVFLLIVMLVVIPVALIANLSHALNGSYDEAWAKDAVKAVEEQMAKESKASSKKDLLPATTTKSVRSEIVRTPKKEVPFYDDAQRLLGKPEAWAPLAMERFTRENIDALKIKR